VKLFVDIPRLKSMMTGMSECRDLEPGRSRVDRGVEYVPVEGQRPNMEVVMTKILTGLLAVAIVGAVVVGAVAAADRLGTRSVHRLGHDPKSSADFGHVPMSRAQGMMPVVTVTAEMPRLVMPTVEVHAVRMVAMSGSDLRVF
jgi:hypothetical protein